MSYLQWRELTMIKHGLYLTIDQLKLVESLIETTFQLEGVDDTMASKMNDLLDEIVDLIELVEED
ncbi:hypothetical protein [Chamaesiphon sp.]|uniref:hypothetical protein n=1 Tax=Chamaesiphon sp. TaxID=2814140 RepID=UPI00359354BA